VGWNGAAWQNFGQEISGTEGTGGFVTSAYSEPPPFGIEAFTIGSASALNALPVELNRFEVIPETDRVYLKWETESESNASHFEVERSLDGSHFEKINSVNSKGGYGTAAQYFVKDNSPYYGLNYYRLKMVDNDGTYEYSRVEVINLNKDTLSPLQVYPNPVNEVLNINVAEWLDQEVMIEIFNINGAKILQLTILMFL